MRYADDVIVMCWSRSQAERALERLTGLLAGLGLEPKAAKTRIVRLEVGGGGFEFLGLHHRLVRSPGLNGKRPVARRQGDAACPRPGPGTDPPVASAAAGRCDRGGP